MIKITPTSHPTEVAVEFIERHIIPLLLAFALGLLVMDWRSEQAQGDRIQALHDQLKQANLAAAQAGAALNKVLLLVADVDGDCGAPAGIAPPDALVILTGLGRVTSAASGVAP